MSVKPHNKETLSVSQREVFGHLPAGFTVSPEAILESMNEEGNADH